MKFNIFKNLFAKIKKLNKKVDFYNKDNVVKAMPTIAYVNRAKKLIQNGEFNEAEKILLFAKDISANDFLINNYLGIIYERRRYYPKAVEYYFEAVKLNPNDKYVWYRLAMCLMYSNLLEKALKAFEQANKKLPHNTDVFTGWGMTYMKMKKYALAKDKFNTAAQISKYNYSAILLSAVMEIRLGEYQIAEEKLEFLVKVAPNESSNYEYANLKLIQSKYDEAIDYAQKAISYNKLMLPAYFVLLEIYSIKRQFDLVEQTFSQAVNLKLDGAELRFEMGKALIRLLEFEKAKEQFEKSLEINPRFIDAKIGLALINAYNNDFDLVLELRERYLDNVYVQEALGLKSLHDGDLEYAVQAFNKALKTDKNQTYLYYDLVCAYKGLKKNDKIRENFEKFVSENPKYLCGIIEYSQWLINVSDFDEARRKLQKAQKLAPSDVKVLNLLFFVQYTLVKKNISEYNIKEAISTANQAINLGKFDYYPEKEELEQILKGIEN